MSYNWYIIIDYTTYILQLLMPHLTDSIVAAFLEEITDSSGTINISELKQIGGGGTHHIYSSDKYPGLLLKVMYGSVGKDTAALNADLKKLNDQYSALYETFEESRCIIEKRAIRLIKSDETENQNKEAIISVVSFDSCFESHEQFGFNIDSEEQNEDLVNTKRYLYGETTRSLLGYNDNPTPYVIRNYPLLNKNFEKIFRLLDAESSLITAMREFLTKYKAFYKREGILLDTIGLNNVLFYKTGDDWQFKLGSVIKHDTGALTKHMLTEIIENPSSVNESFEYFTSVYYMPACIRALNACAAKIGMGKIIDDIFIDNRTIEALANIYLQMGLANRAIKCAEKGNFSLALQLYHQYNPEEYSDDTQLRDILGTLYWEFIRNNTHETSRSEMQAYLDLLLDERNNFPDFRQHAVSEAIIGLTNTISVIDNQNPTVSAKRTIASKKTLDTCDITTATKKILSDIKKIAEGPTQIDPTQEEKSQTQHQTPLK